MPSISVGVYPSLEISLEMSRGCGSNREAATHVT